MSLLFDRRSALGDAPQLHALIVGVSRYRHLPGGDGPEAEMTFGMRQLTSTALSGFRVLEWLQRRKDRLSRPLATARVLLSPSGLERQVEPGFPEGASACTLADFR